MRCFSSVELIKPDPEIGITFRRLLNKRGDREKVMVEQNERKTLSDYTVPLITRANSSIIAPTIQANNFELS